MKHYQWAHAGINGPARRRETYFLSLMVSAKVKQKKQRHIKVGKNTKKTRSLGAPLTKEHSERERNREKVTYTERH